MDGVEEERQVAAGVLERPARRRRRVEVAGDDVRGGGDGARELKTPSELKTASTSAPACASVAEECGARFSRLP